MLLGELISCLEKCRDKYGNVNVCVFNDCHMLPCEAVVPVFYEDRPFVVFCEDDVVRGDFLMLE